jgi:hypothetical protein
MSVPSWWEFVLLTAASYRLWRLVAIDTIADRPRDWLLDRLDEKWEIGLVCPWCSGFWICLGVWGLWQWTADASDAATVTALAVPAAMSAAVGLLAKLDT